MIIGFDVYNVTPGDQLFQIMSDHYGRGRFLEKKEILLRHVRQANPHIPNIDLIFPDQSVALPIYLGNEIVEAQPVLTEPVSARVGQVCRVFQGADAQTTGVLQTLNDFAIGANDFASGYADYLKDNGNALNVLGTSYSAVGSRAKAAASAYAMRTGEVAASYRLYKQGAITKGAYDYQRRLILDATDRQFGVLRKTVGSTVGKGPAATRSVFRMSMNETKVLQSSDDTMRLAKGVSSRAKIAGRAFIGLTVAVAAVQAVNAETPRESTIIVAEAAGNVGATLAAGVVTALLISNPVGWTACIGIAAISMGAGMLGGEMGKAIGEAAFDSFGDKVSGWFN